MEIGQIERSLAQILENYQRCGLKRFSLAENISLSADALAVLKQIRERSSDSPQEQRPPSTSGQAPSTGAAANQSIADSTAKPTEPAPVPTPSVSDAPAGAWGLPVLGQQERAAALSELDGQIKACRQCADIVTFRRQTVFGVGPDNPTVCFMGEAPGADEDRLGEPFVGKAGQLLTKIIGAMKLTREEVYILNALKCRPPQNRTPVPEEIGNCRHFVQMQLDILQPKYIVCLGAVAVRSLLQSEASIGRLRGKFYEYRGAKVVVTYHPSYLLRNESAKRLVWDDMKMLMAKLGHSV